MAGLNTYCLHMHAGDGTAFHCSKVAKAQCLTLTTTCQMEFSHAEPLHCSPVLKPGTVVSL